MACPTYVAWKRLTERDAGMSYCVQVPYDPAPPACVTMIGVPLNLRSRSLKMERASRLMGKLSGPIDVDDLARAAWPLAVGKKVAARARPARMVRKRLIVEVEDPIWKKQLFTLSRQILTNLERHLGQGIVEDLEFRVVPPRRGPQRAEVAQPALAALDDADQIADPVMRNMYKLARKKALA